MKDIIMRILLLTFVFSCFVTTASFASASVGLEVEMADGELEIINKATKTGFLHRGGKNYWAVVYTAKPGAYTIIGRNPGCSPVVQSASFEEGKAYGLILTKECTIKRSTDKSAQPLSQNQ